MSKMTRQEYIKSKKKKKHGGGIFLSLTEEEHSELTSKAAEFKVTMVAYAKSRIFYD